MVGVRTRGFTHKSKGLGVWVKSTLVSWHGPKARTSPVLLGRDPSWVNSLSPVSGYWSSDFLGKEWTLLTRFDARLLFPCTGLSSTVYSDFLSFVSLEPPLLQIRFGLSQKDVLLTRLSYLYWENPNTRERVLIHYTSPTLVFSVPCSIFLLFLPFYSLSTSHPVSSVPRILIGVTPWSVFSIIRTPVRGYMDSLDTQYLWRVGQKRDHNWRDPSMLYESIRWPLILFLSRREDNQTSTCRHSLLLDVNKLWHTRYR